jgi:hypothetical protein
MSFRLGSRGLAEDRTGADLCLALGLVLGFSFSIPLILVPWPSGPNQLCVDSLMVLLKNRVFVWAIPMRFLAFTLRSYGVLLGALGVGVSYRLLTHART